MLNRLIRFTGLALALSLIGPAAQPPRSGSLSAAVTPDAPRLTGELNSSLPLAASAPLPETMPLDNNISDAVALAPATPQAEDVRLEIHLGRREVLVYQGERTINRYPIGVGRAGWETPVGTFQVRQMRENPTWISPFNGQRISGGDARNPLGTRWIGFWTDGNNWIGFHGTRNPATVGRNASHGCIHMHRSDLEALYRQVKFGTLVTVVP
jgi:lipoprotein-anchoring transpeptidase ErfK/SrfK